MHDDTGDQVEHGYYFDEFGINVDPSYFSSPYSTDDFFHDDSAYSTDDSLYDDSLYGDSLYDDTATISSSTGPLGVADHTGSYSSYQSYYSYQTEQRFSGGDFTVYPDRRKVRLRRLGYADGSRPAKRPTYRGSRFLVCVLRNTARCSGCWHEWG